VWLWLAASDVAFHPGELFFLLEQRLFGEWNQQVTINLPVDKREAAIAVIVRTHEANFVHDDVRIKARIVCCFEQEAQHALRVVGMARPRNDDMRYFIFGKSVGGSVTDGAVVRDSRETDDLFRKADGNFMAFFPNHAKRLVAARPGRQVGKNPRQDHPEIIRDAAIALRAKRAIFEMFLFVREHFFFFPEEFHPHEQSAQRNQNHEHNRRNPKETFCFGLEVHSFVDQALIKRFSDIRRWRLFPEKRASFRRLVLRGQHLSCPHSDRVASRRQASLAYRT
jgi:hypothetical protein